MSKVGSHLFVELHRFSAQNLSKIINYSTIVERIATNSIQASSPNSIPNKSFNDNFRRITLFWLTSSEVHAYWHFINLVLKTISFANLIIPPSAKQSKRARRNSIKLHSNSSWWCWSKGKWRKRFGALGKRQQSAQNEREKSVKRKKCAPHCITLCAKKRCDIAVALSIIIDRMIMMIGGGWWKRHQTNSRWERIPTRCFIDFLLFSSFNDSSSLPLLRLVTFFLPSLAEEEKKMPYLMLFSFSGWLFGAHRIHFTGKRWQKLFERCEEFWAAEKEWGKIYVLVGGNFSIGMKRRRKKLSEEGERSSYRVSCEGGEKKFILRCLSENMFH